MPESNHSASAPLFGGAGRVVPLWLWFLQRASAVVVGPLVVIHVVYPGAASHPWISGLLLVTILAHGISGFWRLAAARGVSQAAYKFLYTLGLAMGLALGIMGVMIIASTL